MHCSYIEIYNEEIRDLVSKNPKERLDLKEDPETGVYVKGVSQIPAKDANALLNVSKVGFANRSVGATLMNAGSSRSHSIFMVTVETSKKVSTCLAPCRPRLFANLGDKRLPSPVIERHLWLARVCPCSPMPRLATKPPHMHHRTVPCARCATCAGQGR